jgi:hypothetical protein
MKSSFLKVVFNFQYILYGGGDSVSANVIGIRKNGRKTRENNRRLSRG